MTSGKADQPATGDASPQATLDQAEKILRVCGAGTFLHVGCGAGRLVRTLLELGLDARGIDESSAVDGHAGRMAPGRLAAGSLPRLPYAQDAFDTVICTLGLDLAADDDARAAIVELARVARRAVYLIAPPPRAAEPSEVGSERGRGWWQQACFDAGLSVHPRAMVSLPFTAIEHDGPGVTLAMEKLGASHAGCEPDPLRTPGREGDVLVAAAMHAAGCVRPGDVVAAPGGDGGGLARVLLANSEAGRVVVCRGDDIGQSLAPLARDNGRVEETAIDIVGFLRVQAGGGLDMIVARQSADASWNPDGVLREARRVLSPGGRLVLMVRGDGDRAEVRAALADQEREGSVRLEQVLALRAGTDHRHAGTPSEGERRARLVADLEQAGHADWLVLVLMASPLRTPAQAYRERVFPGRRGVVVDFARSYDNPWLVRALISVGQRVRSRALLREWAGVVADRAACGEGAGSPDEGAALCVMLYDALHADSLINDEHVGRLMAQARCYATHHPTQTSHTDTETTPRAQHVTRWRCSLAFVLGLLEHSRGRLKEAEDMFLACCDVDVLGFSPLLATKTIEAWWRAGLMAATRGDHGLARERWKRGLEEADRILRVGGDQAWEDRDDPLPFALPELIQALDCAAKCASALHHRDEWTMLRGAGWHNAHETPAWNSKAGWRAARQLSAAWEHQHHRLRELEDERDKAWSEAQRLAGEWRHVAQRVELLARGDGPALTDRLILERDEWMREAKRLEEEWGRVCAAREALRGDFERVYAELRDHVGESRRERDAWEQRERELVNTLAAHEESIRAKDDALSRLEAARAAMEIRLDRTQRALEQVRRDVDQMQRSMVFRALRRLRVLDPVHVPRTDPDRSAHGAGGGA